MIARGENGERIPLDDGGPFRLELVRRPAKVDNLKVADTLVEQWDGDVHTHLRTDRQRIAKMVPYGDFVPVDAGVKVNRTGRFLSVRSGPDHGRQAEEGPHGDQQGQRYFSGNTGWTSHEEFNN
jgi:hypothetical protein